MNYAQLAARHFARATSLEAALRKIMAAHRFNVADLSVTQVHSVCFDAIQPGPEGTPGSEQSFPEYVEAFIDGMRINRTEPGKPIPVAVSSNYSPVPDYKNLAYDWEVAALYWMRQCDLWRALPRYSVVDGHEVAAQTYGRYIRHDQMVLEPAGGPMLTDHKTFHDQALAASNEAGYAGMSPAEVIKAQFENIADLEATAQALEDEVGPLLADIKSALQGHALDIDASGLLARIEKVLK